MEGAGEGGAEMPGDEEPYPPPPTPNTRPEVVDTTEVYCVWFQYVIGMA